jgi:uncharacterized protein (DUF2062 family)
VERLSSRLKVLAENCSGEKLALILALGLVLGTFPIFGIPTVLCAVAALVLRLNMAALQVVNQLSAPLQLALLIPFERLGWRFPLPAGSSVLWKWSAMAFQAVTGWFLICVPLGVVFYLTLRRIFRRSGGRCPQS